jgi:Ca2+/H+ antiporter, TMEM165/GDT1 family
MFEPFNTLFTSTAVVALAEIGDKTQLLSFALAARYRRSLPIVAGILLATLLNHFCAAWAGQWLVGMFQQWFSPNHLKLGLAASFVAMAGWLLVPDKLDEETVEKSTAGIFLTTLTAFFLAEMGDKTQIATVLLAANTTVLWAVVIGTTFGMMIANVPAVLMGDKLARRLTNPKMLALVHRGAALIFVGIGIAIAASVAAA